MAAHELKVSTIRQQEDNEHAIRELSADNAVVTGNLAIASNILHDIGNAVVGFGSHITRIKRSLEQSSHGNLHKLAEFFLLHQPAMASAVGEGKAAAIVKLINGIIEEQKVNQEEVRRSIADQLNIITHIQEILFIQRQYNGNEFHEKAPVKFSSVINDCISILFASIEKRGIAISIDIPEDLPDFSGDRTRLMQVILNLLKNSIEAIDIYAPKKNIFIGVALHEALFVIRIQDNGHGFDSATRSNLFKRGFTTKASGSGFGLNSCRAIIESYGGTIDIQSEGSGKGSLISIKLNSNIQSNSL